MGEYQYQKWLAVHRIERLWTDITNVTIAWTVRRRRFSSMEIWERLKQNLRYKQLMHLSCKDMDILLCIADKCSILR